MAVPGKGRRTVNLDPGYLSAENLVLATTKGYSHRPYLRDGIYAELVYIYRGGTFAPVEWTYRDYRDARSIAFFNEVGLDYVSCSPFRVPVARLAAAQAALSDAADRDR